MIVKWKPGWYELDQSLVVGDTDLFYLSKDNLYFASGLLSSGSYDHEVKAKILKITHPELGAIRGIITIGLDYSIYLNDGETILVNAEESPGKIYDPKYIVSEWEFDVHLNIIEKSGLTAMERNYEKYKILSQNEREAQRRERIRRYKVLLGLSAADWDH